MTSIGSESGHEQNGGNDLIIETPLFMRPNTVTMNCGTGCGFADMTNRAADEKTRKASVRKLATAVIFCVIFMTGELVGGIKANSLAVMTDAAHLLTDVAGFAISLFSIWASSWEATPCQSYGFHRIEILGVLGSIQLIWLLTGLLVWSAIHRMLHDKVSVHGALMFAIATVGLVVNIIIFLSVVVPYLIVVPVHVLWFSSKLELAFDLKLKRWEMCPATGEISIAICMIISLDGLCL